MKKIKSISQKLSSGLFSLPYPIGADASNIDLSDGNNVEDILAKVPVERGGTGKNSISKDKMLIGDNNNSYREIGFDDIPTKNSENLLSSGTIFESLKNAGGASQNFEVVLNDNGNYTLVIK